MGKHHNAAKRKEDGAAPTAPAMLAVPLAFRTAPVAPAVRFDGSINPADSVRTKSYPTMELLSIGKSSSMPMPIFIGTEAFCRNPAESKGGTLGHATAGTIVGPNYAVPAQVVVKEVVAKSVQCLLQLKEEFARLLEVAKKAADDPLQMGKDVAVGTYEGLKEELGGIWEALKSVPEVAGALNDLMVQLDAGEINVDDLVGGLGDLIADMGAQLICGYVERAKNAALAGGRAAAKEMGKLAAEMIAKLATSAISGGSGAVAGAAGKIGALGAKMGGIREAIKKTVNDHASKRNGNKPHPQEKPADSAKHTPPPEDRSNNAAEKKGEPPPQCKTCPTAPAKTKKARPVNPILGIKVLFDEDELDFYLPASLPVAWQRFYSSDDSRIGLFGQGWVVPGALELEVRRQLTVLIDGQGRRIEFEAVAPGSEQWSPFEQIWLRRGGTDALLQQIRDASGLPDPYAQIPKEWLEDSKRYFLRTQEGLIAVFAPPVHRSHGARVSPWPCVAVIDRNGYRLQYVHDTANQLAAVVDSAGRVYRMALTEVTPIRRSDSGMRLAGVTLAFDPTRQGNNTTPLSADELLRLISSPLPTKESQVQWLVRYRYQNGNLSEVIDISGKVRRSYGWRNNVMVEHRQPGGLVCQYEYDHYRASGRVVREVVDGFELRFDYQRSSTVVTDGLNRSTTYHFSGSPRQPDQRWTGITHPDRTREHYEYNPFGQLIRVVDELGRETRYELDALGRTTSVKTPDGAVTQVQFGSVSGEVEALVNPLGNTHRWFYDARGNLTEDVNELGLPTHYFYEDERLPDRPTRIRDAHGANKRLVWNAAGQLLSYTDCSGSTTTFQYDQFGHRIAETNAQGHTLRSEFDDAGRLLSVIQPNGAIERYAYDVGGRLIAHRNALGHDTHWRLSPLGQPLERVDALGHRLQYQYDSAGRLAVLTNENSDTSIFDYDVRDRLIEETGFDAKRTEYRYNATGELIERLEHGSAPYAASAFVEDEHLRSLFNVDRGPGTPRRTAFVRDAVGRLRAQYSKLPNHNGENIRSGRHLIRYRYDAAGQVLQATGSDARVEFEWDAIGQLQAEQVTMRSGDIRTPQTQRIKHQYDGLGTRVQTTLPDGRALNFLHYGSGHLHQVNLDGRVLTDVERNTLHQEINRTQGLLSSQYQYDSAGRLIGQQARGISQSERAVQPSSRSVVEREYRYDRAGQLLGIADKRWGASAYGYDPLGRITSARHGDGGIERFAFDPAHNLIDQDRLDRGRQETSKLDDRTDRQREADEWAETVRRRLDDPNFDLLGYATQSLPSRPPGSWAGNRLLVYEDKRFAWDRQGNLVAKRVGRHKAQYFAYDTQGQLTHVLSRNGLDSSTVREQLCSFAYDALGRRVAKHVWPVRALASLDPEKTDHERSKPAFTEPSGVRPHTSTYLWEGNRLLQENIGDRLRTYVWEPDSFVPMLRLDESDDQSSEVKDRTQTLPAQIVGRGLDDLLSLNDESDDDNFAALKANAWGRMASGQMTQHLEQLRDRSRALKTPTHAVKRKSAQILYYHCDHLGTPRELTDENGKLAWSAEYEAWGKIRHLRGRLSANTGQGPHAPADQFWHTRTQVGRANHLPEWVADTTGNLQKWREAKREEMPEPGAAANDASIWGEPTDQSIRFQGQWHDVETGLHYNRFRYYDPDVGRFIHQDPIGLLGGYNLYQYASNPTVWIDVLGLKGAYIFEVTNNPKGDTYIGKGPWSRYLGSTRERGGGAGAPNVSRGGHIDVKSPCGNVSDSDYAFIVEDRAMELYKDIYNKNAQYLNERRSPGANKLIDFTKDNKCPVLKSKAEKDARKLINAMLAKAPGSGRF